MDPFITFMILFRYVHFDNQLVKTKIDMLAKLH